MKEIKNVPQLRFSGFNDEWEENKLGDSICEINERTSDFNLNPLFSLTIENGITEKTERYERSQLVTKEDDLFKIMHPQNFATNPMNLRFGAVGYSKEKNDISVSGYYDVFSIDNNECSDFWYSYFKTDKTLKKFDDAATGSLIEKRRVHFSVLKQLSFLQPNFNEKQKIGAFLSHVDSLIQAKTKKLEFLKAVKKSLLQKCFPKAGEKVPEMRFAGFSGDWEEKKLGEVCQLTMGQSPDGSTYSVTPSTYILVQGNADMKDGFVFPRIWTTQKTKIAHPGDLIFSVRAPVGEVGKTKYEIVIGRGVAALKGNEFVFQELIKMNEFGYWNTISCGSTFESINSNDLYNAAISIPPTVEEQQKIGQFFSKYDSLIRAQQKEIDKLKDIKKSLLQKMFI